MKYFNKLCVWLTLLALSGLMAAQLHAQERKAYKVVDKNGNVTYSQTPPVDGQDAKPLSTKPAMAGRGGAVGNLGAYSPYDNPRNYSSQQSYSYGAQRQLSPQEQRQAALKAECERQRGTDCNNASALQYMDSTAIPRRGRN